MLHLLGAAPETFPAENLAAIRLLLDQAGVTLRNSRLWLQTVSWARRLARLQAVGTEIGATLDLPAVLSAAVGWAVDLVDASWGVLGLWSPQTHLLRVETGAKGRDRFDTGHRVAMLGEGLVGRAAVTAAPWCSGLSALGTCAAPAARAGRSTPSSPSRCSGRTICWACWKWATIGRGAALPMKTSRC